MTGLPRQACRQHQRSRLPGLCFSGRFTAVQRATPYGLAGRAAASAVQRVLTCMWACMQRDACHTSLYSGIYPSGIWPLEVAALLL